MALDPPDPQLDRPEVPAGRGEALIASIQNRQARVAVIGLGYVGLPLVELFVNAGFAVLGFDIDPVKVETLNQGRSYIGHVNSERVQAMQATGPLRGDRRLRPPGGGRRHPDLRPDAAGPAP